jgi:hypothetical protein
MKKVSYLVISLLVVSALFHSCSEEEDLDKSLIYGRWKPVSGTAMYYRYDSNGNGVTWNPADDQRESEGQAFTWELVKSKLTQIHVMEIGGTGIPKIYTVTELTSTSLKYKDLFSSYSFSKFQ